MLNKNLLLIIFLLIVCLLAPLSFRVGEISITMQTLVIFTAAAVLGPLHGGILSTVYVIAGGMGLPVFAGYVGGMEKLTGYTAGFIWGFIPVAIFVGWACQQGVQSFFHYMIHFFRAHLLLLIPGMLVLHFSLEGVEIWGTLIRLAPGLLIKTIAGGMLALWLKQKLLPAEAEA